MLKKTWDGASCDTGTKVPSGEISNNAGPILQKTKYITSIPLLSLVNNQRIKFLVRGVVADVNKYSRTWLTYRAVVEAPSPALHFHHGDALFIAYATGLADYKYLYSSKVHCKDDVVMLCRGPESCVV
jgi:hypothetical protein